MPLGAISRDHARSDGWEDSQEPAAAQSGGYARSTKGTCDCCAPTEVVNGHIDFLADCGWPGCAAPSLTDAPECACGASLEPCANCGEARCYRCDEGSCEGEHDMREVISDLE